MDRIRLSSIIIVVLIVIVGAVLITKPRTNMQNTEKPKTVITNITIGVIPGPERTLAYKILSNLAQDDLNTYCEERKLNIRFRYNISASIPSDDLHKAVTYTKAFQAAGVDMILGYEWSVHLGLVMGAGYHKKMVLMTPSAQSSIYSLRNDILYHLCVLSNEPIEVTLKAMSDRGVKAILLIYIPHYYGSDIVDSLRYLESPKFEETRILPCEQNTSIKSIIEGADNAMEEMIGVYGRNQTAILWFSFPVFPDGYGLGGSKFLAEAANSTTLSSVNWYVYEETPSRGTLNWMPYAPPKLRLITLERVIRPNPTYNRLNRVWVNATGSPSPLGYLDANIYDGLWVLSLSAIKANRTDPLEIMEVLPSVASEYVGATGRCTLDDTGARLGADYDVYAYFEVEGKTRSLLCGSYGWEEDRFTWDNDLLG